MNSIPDLDQAFTATPEYRIAAGTDPSVGDLYQRHMPPFTTLQNQVRRIIIAGLPGDLPDTARALFCELEETIRDLRNQNDKPDEKLAAANAMKVRLQNFLLVTAPIVGEAFELADFNSPQECFLADRIISKLFTCLRPEATATPEPHSAEWFRRPSEKSEDDTDFRTKVRAFLEDVLALDPLDPAVRSANADQLLVLAKERREFVRIRTRPVAIGQDYDMQEEEIKELQFQNGELSRQCDHMGKERDELAERLSSVKVVLARHLSGDPLFNVVPIDNIIDQKLSRLAELEAERSTSAVSTLTDEVQGWHNAATKYAELVEAWRQHLDYPTSCAISVFGIEQAAQLLQRKDDEIARLKGELDNAPTAEDVTRLTREKNSLADGMRKISEAITPFTAIKTWRVGDTLLGTVERLVEDWRKLHTAGYKEASDAPAPSGDYAPPVSTIVVETPPPPVRVITDTAVQVEDRRSPFVKVDGTFQFRQQNPDVPWLRLSNYNIPVPILRSLILMSTAEGGHVTTAAHALSLIPSVGTDLGRCFGRLIGMLRDGTATADDLDAAIAKRLEAHPVVWPETKSEEAGS